MLAISKSLIFSLSLCFILLFGLAACGWGEKEPLPTPVPTLVITLPTQLPTLLPTPTPVPTPTVEPTLAPTVAPTALATTQTATATAPITTTSELTTTSALTATAALTTTDNLTTSNELTTTETLTTSAWVTATAPLTVTAVTTPTAAPRVFFRQPTANAILPLTSTVVAGVEGLVVEPAGGTTRDAGHLHLLIDADYTPPGDAIPKDERHLHLGDGALAITVTLTPGEHRLRLQFADGNHLALAGEQYRAELPVFVVAGAPAQAVRFVQPTASAVVSSTVAVVMAATGLIIEPAGEVRENAGHLHLLVDSAFTAPGDAIPKDETHLHLGQGQMTTTLGLPPGEHTLRLQFANGAHVALAGEQYRDEIQVTVQ